MIQTSFFRTLQDGERSGNPIAKKYMTRYVHPKTGAVLKKSTYIKNEKKTRGLLMYFINNEWVKEEDVPERREWRKKRQSSLEGFLLYFKGTMAEKEKLRGRFLIGDNEFVDKKNCYDKVLAHFNEQVERYGYRCPITDVEFTTIRNHRSHYDGIRREIKPITTNISADRLLNHIHYTKQNVLFTSAGWNNARGELSLAHMRFFLNKNHVERYEEILRERFPNIQGYE
tara:strand:+ start:42 stop:725 length:684 start_codon:yes stop_codon:yes gene_type:complete